MKRLHIPYLLVSLPLLALLLSSCLGDDINSEYSEWKQKNDEWIIAESMRLNPDGTPYYKRLSTDWNPTGYVLIHWHNNTALTANKLSPMSSSTVDVKYRLTNYLGEPKDSSYLRVTPADSIYRSKVNANITGWIMALPDMHIGDSVTLVVPYREGYGAQIRTNLKPYSNLIFDLKLVDIPGYEINVK